MPRKTTPPAATAIAGAACISSSAVLMRLADTSASITALGRCGFALPVLGALALAERRRGAPRLPSRSRWLARLAGLFLAGDLILWSHAITAIGAGLGTVVTNLQVLIISLLAWLILGERPRRSLVLASPVMLAGLALVGGLGGLGGTADKQMIAYLEAHRDGATWLVAVQGSSSAASIILATGGIPVMAMGGFRGTDAAPTLAQFEQYVKQGKVQYVLTGARGGLGGGAAQALYRCG